MLKDFKAIIFDASNTLFFGDGGEFEQAGLYSLYYHLWQLGTDLVGIDLSKQGISKHALWLRWEAVRKQAKGDAEHRQVRTTKLDIEDLLSEIVSVDLTEQRIAEFEAVYYAGVVASTQALPDMYQLLKTLKENYKLAVVSNTRSHYFIEESIRDAKLLEYFDVVITSEQVGWRKPHKNIFEAALKQLSTEANQTVMIGDSLSKDILGAQSLGMQTVWLSLNSSEKLNDVDAIPDYQAMYPLDIIPILEAIHTENLIKISE